MELLVRSTKRKHIIFTIYLSNEINLPNATALFVAITKSTVRRSSLVPMTV